MAYADYTHCAVCDSKAFYDASLNWDFDRAGLHDLNGNSVGIGLDNCAQNAAICTECFEKGWRIKLVEPNAVTSA